MVYLWTQHVCQFSKKSEGVQIFFCWFDMESPIHGYCGHSIDRYCTSFWSSCWWIVICHWRIVHNDFHPLWNNYLCQFYVINILGGLSICCNNNVATDHSQQNIFECFHVFAGICSHCWSMNQIFKLIKGSLIRRSHKQSANKYEVDYALIIYQTFTRVILVCQSATMYRDKFF